MCFGFYIACGLRACSRNISFCVTDDMFCYLIVVVYISYVGAWLAEVVQWNWCSSWAVVIQNSFNLASEYLSIIYLLEILRFFHIWNTNFDDSFYPFLSLLLCLLAGNRSLEIVGVWGHTDTFDFRLQVLVVCSRRSMQKSTMKLFELAKILIGHWYQISKCDLFYLLGWTYMCTKVRVCTVWTWNLVFNGLQQHFRISMTLCGGYDIWGCMSFPLLFFVPYKSCTLCFENIKRVNETLYMCWFAQARILFPNRLWSVVLDLDIYCLT